MSVPLLFIFQTIKTEKENLNQAYCWFIVMNIIKMFIDIEDKNKET